MAEMDSTPSQEFSPRGDQTMVGGQIIVLGMHRSGTSCVGNLLTRLGVYFGDPAISTGAGEENPKGFFERRDLREICDAILQGSGCDWWSISDFSPERVPMAVRREIADRFDGILAEMEEHRPWFIKEPRLCYVWPLLRAHVNKPVLVHVWRHPVEVAQSLSVRNGFPIDFGIALWEAYVRAAHAASFGTPSLTICYNKLIASPASETERIVERLGQLGVQGIRMPDPAEIRDAVEPELHRNRRTSPELDEFLSPAQRRLFAALSRGREDDPALIEPLSMASRLRIEDWTRREGVVIDLSRRAADGRRSAAEAAKLREDVAASNKRISELSSGIAKRDQRRIELEDENRKYRVFKSTAEQMTKTSEKLEQAWKTERTALVSLWEVQGKQALQATQELQRARRSWEDERSQLLSQVERGSEAVGRLEESLAKERERHQAAMEQARIDWNRDRAALVAQSEAQAAQALSALNQLEQSRRSWDDERSQLLYQLQQGSKAVERLEESLATERERHQAAIYQACRDFDRERAELGAQCEAQATQARQATHELERVQRTWQDERSQLLSQLQMESQAVKQLQDALNAERQRLEAMVEQVRSDWASERAGHVAQRDVQTRQIEELQARLANEQSTAKELSIRILEDAQAQFSVCREAVERQHAEEVAESHRTAVEGVMGAVRIAATQRREGAALTSFLRGMRALPEPNKMRLHSLFLHYRLLCRRADAADLVLVATSGLFDPAYYFGKYEDVAESGMDPLVHFMDFGAQERRNPSALFDTGHYVDSNPDVAKTGINPLLHFVTIGRQEGRLPRPVHALTGNWTLSVPLALQDGRGAGRPAPAEIKLKRIAT